QGKFQAKVICCILGIGGLASWNSLLTIADYYYKVFPEYHPSRVLVLVYQPFALGTIVILAYHESKINTRKRNLIVGFDYQRTWWSRTLYWFMRNCCFFWPRGCYCSRRNDG
ncbi:unnamed protein product, partial [Brassica oleracea var. botrytis]